MNEVQDKTTTQERAARIMKAMEASVVGGAAGAGVSLIAVFAVSALSAIVPVGGTVIGALVGAGVSSWLRTMKEKQKSETRNDPERHGA